MAWDDNTVTTLTNLTETTEFKEKVSEFEKPNVEIQPVSAEPPRQYQGLEYALLGMAVDYLLRFKIQRENTTADIYTGDLIAEHATQYESQMTTDVAGVLAGAKASYTAYINGSDSVPTQAVLDLARLENIVRGGPSVIETIEQFLGRGGEAMEVDLENMLALSDEFTTVEEYAVLNPVLANSGIVADADIIRDGTLIDMKTTVNPTFDAKFWRQLIGYLVLLDIRSGVDGTTHGWTMEQPEEFGVYFCRSGDLQLFDASIVYDHPDYLEVKGFVMSQM